MKRVENLRFYTLIARFNEYYDSYLTLLFANTLLHEYLIDEGLQKDLRIKNYVIAPTPEKMDQCITLTGQTILDIIGFLSTRRSYGLSEAKVDLLKMNAHFLRTRYLNSLYEAIMNFLEGLDKGKRKRVSDDLFKRNWFKVLRILRDNSSHFDNFGKITNWHWPKEDIIKWESIEIKKTDIGNDIRYNDYEVILLGQVCREYFIVNEAHFDKN